MQGYTLHIYMDDSKNSDTPKTSILIGCSIINHSFWGTPIFGNTYQSSKDNFPTSAPDSFGLWGEPGFWKSQIVYYSNLEVSGEPRKKKTAMTWTIESWLFNSWPIDVDWDSFTFCWLYMGVSLNGGTPKTPQNDHF